MSTIPTLTLNPGASAEAQVAAQTAVQEEKSEDKEVANVFDLSSLSAEEQAAVLQFSDSIDILNTEQVLNYGSAAQKNIAAFSESTLESVKTKDLGQVGTMLSDLVVELKGLNFAEEEKKGLKGLFKKARHNIASLKAQYDKAEVNVDKIVEHLEAHEITLLKDVSMLDIMFKKNEEYLKELTMYIIAGKLKIESLRNTELKELQKKAVDTGLIEDAQKANDFANMIGRFEKKIHDLELTRTISLQMSPQIRMIQNNDTIMSEKIRSSIVNTIPLWKSQMVMALSMYHSESAMKAQNEVNEVTNQLLKQNAAALHQGSVNIAKEAERGIVDLETLKKTNQELIDTLDEVRHIQDEGRAGRAQAEKELSRIEDELKTKLLAING